MLVWVCTLSISELVVVGELESSAVEAAVSEVEESSTTWVDDAAARVESSVVEDGAAATSLEEEVSGVSSQLVKQLHPLSTLTLQVQPAEQYQLLSIPEHGMLAVDEGHVPFGCSKFRN